MSKQLAITKGQYTLQSRSIIWISVKTPRNLDINSLFKISLDRQLPNGFIPLDVLHSIKNKQPQELTIPLLNTVNIYQTSEKHHFRIHYQSRQCGMCRKCLLRYNTVHQ